MEGGSPIGKAVRSFFFFFCAPLPCRKRSEAGRADPPPPLSLFPFRRRRLARRRPARQGARPSFFVEEGVRTDGHLFAPISRSFSSLMSASHCACPAARAAPPGRPSAPGARHPRLALAAAAPAPGGEASASAGAAAPALQAWRPGMPVPARLLASGGTGGGGDDGIEVRERRAGKKVAQRARECARTRRALAASWSGADREGVPGVSVLCRARWHPCKGTGPACATRAALTRAHSQAPTRKCASPSSPASSLPLPARHLHRPPDDGR